MKTSQRIGLSIMFNRTMLVRRHVGVGREGTYGEDSVPAILTDENGRQGRQERVERVSGSTEGSRRVSQQ